MHGVAKVRKSVLDFFGRWFRVAQRSPGVGGVFERFFVAAGGGFLGLIADLLDFLQSFLGDIQLFSQPGFMRGPRFGGIALGIGYLGEGLAGFVLVFLEGGVIAFQLFRAR